MEQKTVESMITQGWYISEDGYNIISDNGTIKDAKKLVQIALDTDLKEIGKPSLPNDLNKSKLANVVLQIQKVRNVSAPKSNEDSQAAPRMLKLVLTDGHNYCQALEMSPLSFLSHNKTAPGSKLLIKNATFTSGYLMLEQNSCQLLGGQVPALYEKWQINKLSKHTRARFDGEGPPPWVNFGKKIISADELQSFKSLDPKQKNKESTEFDMQRQDAIAEVASGAVRKTFGGGLKQNLANQANQNSRPQHSSYEPREPRKQRERKPRKETTDEEKPQKPSDKISLFDFLETKLPPQEQEGVQRDIPVAYSSYNEIYQPSYNQERNNQNRFNNGDSRGSNNQRNYQNSKPHGSHSFRNDGPRNDSYHQRNDRSYQRNDSSYQRNDSSYQRNDSSFQRNDSLRQRNDSSFQRNDSSRQRNDSSYQRNDSSRNQHSDSLLPRGNNSYQRGENWSQRTDSSHQRGENSHQRNQKPVEPKQAPEQSKLAPRADKNDVNNLSNAFNKMNVNSANSDFASRSLKQHLNLQREPRAQQNPVKNSSQNAGKGDQTQWKIGDQCLAKYWEDNKYYSATVTAVTDKTCVVQFNEYGNFEEVLQGDCLPAGKEGKSGSMEFRRGGNRQYKNNKNFVKSNF